MATRLPFEDVRQMSGNPQYQGSQVQGSYIQAGQPLDVSGMGQQAGGIAKGFMDIFQASAGIYQKYKDVHRRTTLNEKQVEYNNNIKEGIDRFKKESPNLDTARLKPENLEKTINKYVKPFNEFIDNDEVFKDDEELKSRASVIFQAKFFKAQGQMLEMAEKELTSRHLKHINIQSDSKITELSNTLDDGKAKSIIKEYQNTTIRAAIDDGVLEPWQGTKEIKRIYEEWLTTKFDADYDNALVEGKEDQFLKDWVNGKYKVTFKNSSGEDETVGLRHNRIRGTLNAIRRSTIGKSRAERKKFQITEYEVEIAQRPGAFLEKYGKKEEGIWVADETKFTDDLLEGSDQNKLIKSAFTAHEADLKRKKEGAVPLTKDDEERFYQNTADFYYQEELFDPAGNKDPEWEFQMVNDEQRQTHAQIRSFAQLLGQINEKIDNASSTDLREFDRQLQEHMNLETDSGSKMYKQKLYNQYNNEKLSVRKIGLEEAPADMALSDLLKKDSPDDVQIAMGNAEIPFDALLEKQKQLGLINKDSTVISIPESFKDKYREIHESPDKTSILRLNTMFGIQYGDKTELMKREYIRELTASDKGTDAEFGAVWMMGENISPSTKADLILGLQTKAEAVSSVPSQLKNIQKWSSRNGSILRIIPESNQKGAIIKAIDFMAKSNILNLNDPTDEDSQYFAVERAAKEILFGATPNHGWTYSQDKELGSGLIARNSMWKNLQSDEKGKDLSHAALVGKLNLTPDNIDFGPLRFPGWDEEQVKDFKNRIIYSDVSVSGMGTLGIAAVANPLNANSWVYGLVQKRPGSDTPELIAPVKVDGEPLIYSEDEIETELLPARHKLEYLEELVPWKMFADRNDVVKKPKLSFQDIQELVQEELNPKFKNKMIVGGQKWFIDNIGELEQDVLSEVLLEAESESDEDVFNAIVKVASEYGGMESSWSRFTGKWFDTRPKSETSTTDKRKASRSGKRVRRRTSGELLYRFLKKDAPSTPEAD